MFKGLFKNPSGVCESNPTKLNKSFSLRSGIFQVMFSIIALDFFKLKPEQNGYLMAYFGIASMVSVTQMEMRWFGFFFHDELSDARMFVQVVQGGVVGRLTARYSESSLLLLSIGVSSFVGLAQVHTKPHTHTHTYTPELGRT